jgi:hypothetical protein
MYQWFDETSQNLLKGQNNETLHNINNWTSGVYDRLGVTIKPIIVSAVMLCILRCQYADCHSAMCHCANCHYAGLTIKPVIFECFYAECHSAK